MKITKEYLKEIIKEELQKEMLGQPTQAQSNIFDDIKNLNVSKNWAPTLRDIGNKIVANKVRALSDTAGKLGSNEEGRILRTLIGNIQFYFNTVKSKDTQLKVAKALNDKATEMDQQLPKR